MWKTVSNREQPFSSLPRTALPLHEVKPHLTRRTAWSTAKLAASRAPLCREDIGGSLDAYKVPITRQRTADAKDVDKKTLDASCTHARALALQAQVADAVAVGWLAVCSKALEGGRGLAGCCNGQSVHKTGLHADVAASPCALQLQRGHGIHGVGTGSDHSPAWGGLAGHGAGGGLRGAVGGGGGGPAVGAQALVEEANLHAGPDGAAPVVIVGRLWAKVVRNCVAHVYMRTSTNQSVAVVLSQGWMVTAPLADGWVKHHPR